MWSGGYYQLHILGLFYPKIKLSGPQIRCKILPFTAQTVPGKLLIQDALFKSKPFHEFNLNWTLVTRMHIGNNRARCSRVLRT